MEINDCCYMSQKTRHPVTVAMAQVWATNASQLDGMSSDFKVQQMDVVTDADAGPFSDDGQRFAGNNGDGPPANILEALDDKIARTALVTNSGQVDASPAKDEAYLNQSVATRGYRRFIPPNPTDARDYLPDNLMRDLRGNSKLSDAILSGESVPLRWPATPLTHSEVVSFSVVFTAKEERLKDLLDDHSGMQPLILKADCSRLSQHLYNLCELPNDDYHFAPHEMYITGYCNKGVPVGWHCQLTTRDADKSEISWFFTDTIHHGVGDSKAMAIEIPPDSCAAFDTPSQVYVADATAVGQAPWSRWAPQSRRKIMRDLADNHVHGNIWYKFALPDEDAVVAPHPVLHAALLNISRLVQQSESSQVYSKYNLSKTVSRGADGRNYVLLPKQPVDSMVDSVFKDTNASNTLMDLKRLQMELRPALGYDRIKTWIDERTRSTPPYIHNPLVTISVTVQFQGVVIKRKHRAL
ncbi:MAG: hypothetical protein JKY23_05215 [Nitrospinaceae bacterium]|nr:hypothetical protein [Nitrospinaceae bacterium]